MSKPFLCLVSQNDLDDPERGMIFVCSATHKTKSMFFFLAQTEQGDIFKITLETDEDMVSRPWIEECLFAVIYSYF
jgi:hypothetical protein